MAGFQNLKNPLQIELIRFLLCLQQCRVINSVRSAFSMLFSNKAYFKVCFVVYKIQSPFFSCQSLLLRTSIPNDTWLRYISTTTFNIRSLKDLK